MINQPEYRKKNWNILVPYRFDKYSDFALQEAISLSKVFNTGLVLYSPGCKDEKRHRLAEMTADLISSQGITAQSYTPEKDDVNLLFALASKTEAILIVMGHDRQHTSLGYSLRKTLRLMRKSRTPFLMVPDSMISKSFKDIIFVLGYQKQEKEKILWASYFGRINGSHIHVALPKASDEFFRTGIRSNFQALEKLYTNTEVNFTPLPIEANIHKADAATLSIGSVMKAGAFLMLTTATPDIFDLFGGTAEYRSIRRATDIPVLCINPRDDLYVLCN